MKYGRFKYSTSNYGVGVGHSGYAAPSAVLTNYIAPSAIASNWNIQLRHTYGAKYNTTTRATYGEHILFGGLSKIDYKFISQPNFSTDY